MLFYIVICSHRAFRNDKNLKRKWQPTSRRFIRVWCRIHFRCADWHYDLFTKLEDFLEGRLNSRLNSSIPILQILNTQLFAKWIACSALSWVERISNHFFNPLDLMEQRTDCYKIFQEPKTSQRVHKKDICTPCQRPSLSGRVHETVRNS